MSARVVPSADAETPMSEYEAKVWRDLAEHWERRSKRRSLPGWASRAAERTGAVTGGAVGRAVGAVPEAVKEPIRRAGDVIADKALRPVLGAAASLIELVNDWALELNDPENVEKLARKRGFDIGVFTELREQDLKVCDRLLSHNTLTWRTAGALEGGAMGLLAMVPVAGVPVAMTADVLVVQVLSASIAARIAYSYGYDAKDPDEQAFIQRLVRRSFMAQAAKIKPMNEAAQAARALKGRVRWSEKLRQDHRLVAALEKLMRQLGPAGSKVSVKNVAKVVPFVGIVIGAGMNAAVLGRVAEDAQRYCQTRFLCDRYGLPLPAALLADPEPDPDADPEAEPEPEPEPDAVLQDVAG
ncbi:EcsC family protein [Kitasatospora phosalacinea]|uniref:EcsC family protein n=1 Tax=Kitasatospora phosalacinea TaxID=2065 RepID=UPI00068D1049|nr:EcsC family protein [Kitasatospora phosalacinea]